MPQVASSSPGSYPATTMTADSYPKVPLSGTSTFTSEPQELPLQPSIPPPVPLSLVSNDHSQPPMRSPYPYVQSTNAAPQLSTNSGSSGAHDSSLVPRYVDNSRPAKSPRHPAHQSIHSTSSVANEQSPEYRYGSYAPVNNGSGEIAQPGYAHEAAGQTSAPPRDYYPPSGTWTTTAGEHTSSVGYTSGDVRSYSFPHDQYKGGPQGPSAVKHEQGQPGHPAVYNAAPRGSFDAMNNYSWGGN